MQIRVTTSFDCTATGVTGTFRADKLPQSLRTGGAVHDYLGWTRARNQQRNWETLTQIMQLRSQIEAVTDPQRDETTNLWSFTFAIERDDVYRRDQDPLGCLLDDCGNVPIVIGLGETPGCADTVTAQGPEQNIWFQILDK